MKAWRNDKAAQINAEWLKKHGEVAPPGLARRLARIHAGSHKVPQPMSFLLFQLLKRGGYNAAVTPTQQADVDALREALKANDEEPVQEDAAADFPVLSGHSYAVDSESGAPYTPLAF